MQDEAAKIELTMTAYSPFSLGIALVILALFFFWGSLVPYRTRAPGPIAEARHAGGKSMALRYHEAVLVIEQGGRLAALNDAAEPSSLLEMKPQTWTLSRSTAQRGFPGLYARQRRAVFSERRPLRARSTGSSAKPRCDAGVLSLSDQSVLRIAEHCEKRQIYKLLRNFTQEIAASLIWNRRSGHSR